MHFLGTEIDVLVAGDLLDKVDSKIPRIKETIKAVISRLSFKLSKDRVKDLVTYIMSHINLKSMSALNSSQCLQAQIQDRVWTLLWRLF